MFGRGRLLQLSEHKWANQSPPQVKWHLLHRQLSRLCLDLDLRCYLIAHKFLGVKKSNLNMSPRPLLYLEASSCRAPTEAAATSRIDSAVMTLTQSPPYWLE